MPYSELTKATKELSDRVATLDDRLEANQLLNKRTRVLTLVSIAFGIFAILSTLSIAYLIYESKQAIHTNCTNANETRMAQTQIWDYILGAELADEANNPAETEMSETILPFIHQVFAQRDCKNLDKEYKLPNAPTPPAR